MPNLHLDFGINGLNPANCYQVDMDEWAYSAHNPLATVGAGPCLNVVAHHQNQGCLAHIWNTSTSQTELFHKACFTIREMILNIAHLNDLEIWLGAGHAFRIDSGWANQDPVILDFSTYLRSFLAEMGCGRLTVLDNRTPGPVTYWDPGNIAYSPLLGRIHLLSNRDSDMTDVYAVQTHAKSPRRGVCR